MGDKECASYEVNNGHQKSASTTIQLPVMTSKPVKQQQGSNLMTNKDNQTDPPSSGYYLNVAQKGKLILPTALWLLLIVAGFSFLTLLASLNKAVDTMDSLIEIEQEKEARQERLHHIHDAINEHQHNHRKQQAREDGDVSEWKHFNNKEHDSASLHREHRPKDGAATRPTDSNNYQDRFLDSLIPVKASWFALPSWTSLEPTSQRFRVEPMRAKPSDHHRRRHPYELHSEVASSGENRLIPPQIESIMDDMMRQMMSLDPTQVSDSPPAEISGSIIISSSSDGNNVQLGSGSGGFNMDNKPTDFMDSILKQVMPMLGGAGGSTIDSSIELPMKENNQKKEEPLTMGGPMISAKIENLNINLNGNNDSNTGEQPRPDEKKQVSKKPVATDERNEIEELEKSIDNMVSKLIDRKSTQLPLIVDLNANEAKPLVQQFLGSSEGPKHKHHNHHHHHHQFGTPTGELKSSQVFPSSISNLLMPFSYGFPSATPPTTTTTKLFSNKDQDQNETDIDISGVEKVFKELSEKLGQSSSPAPATVDKTVGEQNHLPMFQPSDPFSMFLIPSQAPEFEVEKSKDSDALKAAPTKDSTESLMNDFIGSMFTLPQFEGGNQQQVGSKGSDSSSNQSGGSSGNQSGNQSSGSSSAGSTSSGEGSSSSVLIETNTPSSITTQLATTTNGSSSPTAVTQTNTTETPLVTASSGTTSQIAAELKLDNLPNDPFLKGFLGVSENDPFFLKEDIAVPATTPPVISSPSKTDQRTLTSTSTQTLTNEPALSSSTTTIATTTTKSNANDSPKQQVTLATNSTPLNTLLAKQIRADEAPLDVPVIDLTPFARTSELANEGTKQQVVMATGADVVGGTNNSTTSQQVQSTITTGGPSNSSVINLSTAPETSSNITSSTHNGTVTVTSKPPQKLDHLSGRPLKSLLEKADDFIGRNLLNFRKLF